MLEKAVDESAKPYKVDWSDGKPSDWLYPGIYIFCICCVLCPCVVDRGSSLPLQHNVSLSLFRGSRLVAGPKEEEEQEEEEDGGGGVQQDAGG